MAAHRFEAGVWPKAHARAAIARMFLAAGLSAGSTALYGGPTGTSVACVFPDGRTHLFGPGRDRCWEAINGRTLMPRAVVACAEPREGDPTPKVTYLFAEMALSTCERGRPASVGEIQPTLQQLGPNERALVTRVLLP